MDGNALPISPDDLYSRLGTAKAPLLIDVRRPPAFEADDRLIVGSARRQPEDVSRWLNALPPGRSVVAYCVQGHEVSQGVASALRSSGVDAEYLEGGIAGWKERKLPTRRKRGTIENKWVTREHPKIDRIACPWLISRFVNPDAEFIYVSTNDVVKVATDVGGTPYDIKGTEFGHVGDQCSFDAIIRIYGIEDPALDHLATIVRGADTSRPDLTPQCEGLLAISYGLSANFPDDHEMLKHGLVMYDALYTWCRLQAKKQAIEVTMPLQPIGTIEIPGSAGSSFDHGAFDPKSRRIFVAHTGRNCVEVIDHDAGRHIATLSGFPEAAGVVADDGTVLVTNRGAGSLAWIDASSLETRAVFKTGARPNGVAIVPQQRLAIAACIGDESHSAELCVLTLDGRQHHSIDLPGPPRWCVTDAAATRVFLAIRQPSMVLVAQLPDLRNVEHWQLPVGGAHGLDIDQQRGRLYVACDDGALVEVDIASGARTNQWPIARAPDVTFFSSTTGLLHIAIGKPGIVQSIDPRTGATTQIVTGPGAHTTALAPPNRLYVFSTSHQGALVYEGA